MVSLDWEEGLPSRFGGEVRQASIGTGLVHSLPAKRNSSFVGEWLLADWPEDGHLTADYLQIACRLFLARLQAVGCSCQKNPSTASTAKECNE